MSTFSELGLRLPHDEYDRTADQRSASASNRLDSDLEPVGDQAQKRHRQRWCPSRSKRHAHVRWQRNTVHRAPDGIELKLLLSERLTAWVE